MIYISQGKCSREPHKYFSSQKKYDTTNQKGTLVSPGVRWFPQSPTIVRITYFLLLLLQDRLGVHNHELNNNYLGFPTKYLLKFKFSFSISSWSASCWLLVVVGGWRAPPAGVRLCVGCFKQLNKQRPPQQEERPRPRPR